MPMHRLDAKICVVTGAARGIGRAISARFHAEGAHVIATDCDHKAGAAAASAIGCRFEPLDVAIEADWQRLAREVPACDVLVNNAGITGFDDTSGPQDPEHAALGDWRRVMAVNLDGTFLGCRWAIGAMKATGRGSIINMASRSGQVGIPGAVAYAASKAAIRNHTRSVALYCAEQGWHIRCNAIAPGAILTPMWDAVLGHGEDRAARMAAMVADAPLQRFGNADEVAAIAVLLASDEAPYMTGSEITVDGGLLAGSAARPR
jgi:NAD(P)-dependent dehydrogenase (short-subunit alcohol dehydrogenase family)